MLFTSTIGSGASYPRYISGASLARFVRHMTPAQRAVLAAEIIEGRVILQALTAKAVVALTGANQPYVNIALRLTPEERVAVAAGDSPMTRSRPRPRAAAAADDWWTFNDDAFVAAMRRIEALSTATEVEYTTNN
jgi:hypothetical protein